MWLFRSLARVLQKAETEGAAALSELAEALGAAGPGDQERVVREALARMARVAERYVGDRDDSLDCAQEALILAIRKFDQFEGRARVTSWLHRIAVNCALGHLRRQGSREEVAIEDLLPTFDSAGFLDNGFQVNDLSAHELLERDDARRQVMSAIRSLPDNHRTVLLMRDIEEMSYREIAEALSLKENAVKVRLHRARSALRQLLAPILAEDGV